MQWAAVHPVTTFIVVSAISATGVFDGFPPGHPTPFDELAAWGKILRFAPQLPQERVVFMKYASAVFNGAFFSKASVYGDKFKSTFFAAFPQLRGKVWVHHA